MDEAIRELLDALEKAEAKRASLTDSPLRDSLQAVLREGFFEQRAGYKVPGDLLLDYTAAAEKPNAAVVKALETFLDRARKAAAAEGLDTAEDRESAFLDSEATSTSGEVGVPSYFD